MIKFLLIIIITSSSAFALIGNEGGGGGFKYYYTSTKYFKNLRNYISESLKLVPPNELKNIEDKYNAKIDWSEFASIVKKARSESLINNSRRNNDGNEEPLLLDYSEQTRTIVTLQPFFELFNKVKLSQEEALEIEKLILHEVSHLFDIGVNSDDEISRMFAEDLSKVLNKYWYYCDGNRDSVNLALCHFNSNASPKDQDIRQINILTSIIKRDGKTRPPDVCQYRVNSWQKKSDLSHWSLANSKILAPVKTNNSQVISLNTSELLPNTLVEINLVCIEENIVNQFTPNQFLQINLTNEVGHTLSPSAIRIFEMTESTIAIRYQFLKLHNGRLRF